MTNIDENITDKNRKAAPLLDVSEDVVVRNVTYVLEEINKNCYKNCTPARLIAVVKTVTPKTINFLKPLKILDIGENRPQVALPKLPQIDQQFALHWIGRLQTNKVKYIIDKVCLIHTLDRLELAKEIDRQAQKHGLTMPCLVQVNIANEPQKGGMPAAQVEAFLRQMKDYPSLRVKGLMAIMPIDASEEELTRLFRGMRELFDRMRELDIEGVAMDELSMGMSNDYRIAAREGATMVRVGSALFKQ